MKKFLVGHRLGREQIALMKAFTRDCCRYDSGDVARAAERASRRFAFVD